MLTRILVCVLAASVAAANDKLPVRRVVLYKSGVGYFEHLGKVRDNQQVAVSFTSSQLDDVLKSLTVLDLDGGRVRGVEYGSKNPVDREAGLLGLPLGEKSTLAEFLGNLRGAKIEVRNGTTSIAGRLMSIERKTRAGGGTTLEVDYVSLLTDRGEVRTTELTPSFSVKLIEEGVAAKVANFLDLLSAQREPDIREMTMAAEGAGDRSLFVSYISETPVWKSTYRIVLGGKAGAKPLLQGWAIVDNTVGQDWENVELSLIAGAPQSFVQELSKPYYARRPVVPFSTELLTAPQTFEQTLTRGQGRVRGRVTDAARSPLPGAYVSALDGTGREVASAHADAEGHFELLFLPAGTIRLEVSAPGFRRATVAGVVVSGGRPVTRDVVLDIGATAETVEVRAFAPPPQMEMASMAERVEMVRRAAVSDAFAKPAGDLFEYKLKQAVTIRRGRSALVPIVHADMAAEKVSVWREGAGWKAPQRALWIDNTTGLTLDGGTFSVLDEGTFAGEGLVESIRPGEKRLLSYASDLAVTPGWRDHPDSERVVRARLRGGVLTIEQEIREKKTYLFRNEDPVARTIIVEHHARSGYELKSQPAPVETTKDWLRFRVEAPPRQTASLTVEEVSPEQATYAVTDVTELDLAAFVSRRAIGDRTRDALRQVITAREQIQSLEREATRLEAERDEIFKDQVRLRENMKALRGSPEEKALLERYTGQLDAQETRLAGLRTQIAATEKQVQAAQGALTELINRFSFEEVL